MTVAVVRTPRPDPAVVDGWVGGSRILFHLGTRRLHVLNRTAAESWDAMAAGSGVDELASTISARYDSDARRVRADLTDLTDRLLQEGLLTWSSASAGTSQRGAPEPEAGRLAPEPGTDRWPVTGSYRALDARLAIRTPDQELGELLATALEPLRSGDDPEWLIRVDPAPDPSGRSPARSSGESFWEISVRSGLRSRVGSRLAAAFRVLGEVNDAAVESVPGHLVIHAGSVGLGDRSILLAGGSNHGKSTLTAALVREGFRYLTDEAAAVGPDLACHPYPKAIALDPGSFDVHPTLRPPAREGLGGAFDSREWHVGVTDPGSVGPPVPIGALVMTRWRPGTKTVLTRSSPVDGLPAVVGSAFDFTRGGQPVFEILCRLVDEVPLYRLCYSDVTEAVDVVRGLLNPPGRASTG